MGYEILGEAGRPAFDGAVAAAARPDFLQSWAWGELKSRTGWVPHRLRVTGAHGAGSVCSLLERRLPGLGPLLYAPRGPIVDWDDGVAVDAALEAVVGFARQRRAVALKLDPAVAEAHPACAAALRRHGLRLLESGPAFEGVQPRFVMHLPLTGRDEAGVLAGMQPKTRYNIRLAERRGVVVRSGTAADMAAFYALLTETARRDGFLVRGPAYFDAMWETCLAAGLGWLLLAEAEGELLAGAIVFRMGDCAWYLYGASANRQRDRMPAYAVQWEAIRRALAAGCRWYDLRGVSGDLSPQAPLHGLYRFKKGFGAELVSYVGEWDRPLRPAAYLLARHGVPWLRHTLAAARLRAGGRQDTPPAE